MDEHNVSLSGGQRHSTSIVRALYHDPSVLLFNESTSALDNQTEQIVMQAVRNTDSAKTIIIIAHRLTTVMDCDCIYILEQGELAGQGRYNELIERSGCFRDIATAGDGSG